MNLRAQLQWNYKPTKNGLLSWVWKGARVAKERSPRYLAERSTLYTILQARLEPAAWKKSLGVKPGQLTPFGFRMFKTITRAKAIPAKRHLFSWDAWRTIRSIRSKASYGPYGGPYGQVLIFALFPILLLEPAGPSNKSSIFTNPPPFQLVKWSQQWKRFLEHHHRQIILCSRWCIEI